jgi:hypothetical protein
MLKSAYKNWSKKKNKKKDPGNVSNWCFNHSENWLQMTVKSSNLTTNPQDDMA